jgi:Ca2+-binding RTX toxin-like protein
MRRAGRILSTLAIAGAALTANVGPASAAQRFGDDFVPDVECLPGFTIYADSAVPGPGVITSLRFTTGADSLANFQFKLGRLVGPNTIETIAQTPPETLPAETENDRSVRIPVAGGEILGFYYAGTKGASCGGGPVGRVIYGREGNAQPGDTDAYEPEGSGRLPISSVLEPDADKDGFGDESQDGCPTNASTQGQCPPPPSCPVGTSPGVTCQTVAGVTTIRGTAGSDRIIGTAGRDVVLCGDGADTVTTGAGNDEVRCGAGADTIDAGVGNDVVLGELGNDKLLGGPGADRLLGGDDQDRLSGGSGKDTASAGDGRDIVGGGSGNDKLNGNAGADRVSGDSGSDSVKGSSGNDRLFGGSGRDRISGGSGRDRLAGGTGRDKLAGGPGVDKTKQ